ncbi:MAG: prolipoprotein diacylglyceryl transferase [Qingshengfaniella sp.]
MILALPYPQIAPEIFSLTLGPLTLALRWYALAYIAGFLIGLWILKRSLARPGLWPGAVAPMTREQADALLTWIVLGVVLGGRLGYVLFYQPAYFLAYPDEIVKVWQGGMAFHGGLAGVIIAAALFCLRHRLPALSVADALALATPPGLFLGRLANFINGELWGRPSDVPWAMAFPDPAAQVCPLDWVGACTRHPSQLYEAGLEGLVLGAVLLWLAFGRRALCHPGRICGALLLGYALARSFVELFRQPDAQFQSLTNPQGYGLILGDWGLTMGQILSVPLAVAGLILLVLSWRRAGRRAGQ